MVSPPELAVAFDLLDPPEWQPSGRPDLLPHQTPPDGPWDLWLMLGGRGAGKTEGCARYFAAYMRRHPGTRGRIIAPTFGDAVEACVTGPSGLQSIDPEIRFAPSDPGGAKVRWPNGSEALVIGTPSPRDVDRLRAGGNRELDWWEEIAANPQLSDAWDQAQLGLRLGTPHSVGSTTPRNTPKLRELLSLDSTKITRATSRDNPHLSDDWRAKLEAMYAGTRLARQEIEGQLLTDVPGALWTPALLDLGRTRNIPDLVRIVVGVDPSGGAGEQGIVVCGVGADGHGYVLEDRSCQLSPRGWGERAVQAYRDWRADRIVVERNFGGDMAEATVLGVDDTVPVTMVTASRGKRVRAEPIANLYGDPDDLEQSSPRVHHAQDADLARLEDQLTTWTPWEGWSPDRMDAAVWALTDLMLEVEPQQRVVEWNDPVSIGADF